MPRGRTRLGAEPERRMKMALSIPNPQFNWGGLLSRLGRAKTDGNESLLCGEVFSDEIN